jgi:predicted  nucleic acid-binding Zn-ribbon protein
MPHECTNCGQVFADGSKEMLSGCPNCGGNKFQFQPSSAMDVDPGAETHEADTGGNTPRRDSGGPSTGSNAWSGTADRALDDTSGADSDPETGSPHAESAGSAESAEPSQQPDSSHQWVNQRDGEASDITSDSTGDHEPASVDDSGPDADTDAPDVESPPDADPGSDDSQSAERAPPEDTAQASARSDVVSPDEIPAAGRDSSDRRQQDPASSSPSGPDRPDRDGPPTDADGRVIEPSSEDRPDLEDLREELNEQFESIRIVAPGEYELNLMELYDRTEYIISLQEDGRYVIEVPDTWDTTPDPGDDT